MGTLGLRNNLTKAISVATTPSASNPLTDEQRRALRESIEHAREQLLQQYTLRRKGQLMLPWQFAQRTVSKKLLEFQADWLAPQIDFQSELLSFLHTIVDNDQMPDQAAFASMALTSLRKRAKAVIASFALDSADRSQSLAQSLNLHQLSNQLWRDIIGLQIQWNERAIAALNELFQPAETHALVARHALVGQLANIQRITAPKKNHPARHAFFVWAGVLRRIERANLTVGRAFAQLLETTRSAEDGSVALLAAAEREASQPPVVSIAAQSKPPIFSIVTPTYETPDVLLRRCVDSVVAQTYPHWEFCVWDDGSKVANIGAALQAYQRQDHRIKFADNGTNAGIAGATNSALQMATGDFVCFLDHDDELAPYALAAAAAHLAKFPDTDVMYSDEDRLDLTGKRMTPFFKPAFSPELLKNCNYICHFLIVRRSLLMQIGGVRPGFDGAQDYDLILRLSEHTRRIAHLPFILYHWRMAPESTARSLNSKPKATESGIRALTEHLQRTGLSGVVHSDMPTQYWVEYPASPSLRAVWATVDAAKSETSLALWHANQDTPLPGTIATVGELVMACEANNATVALVVDARVRFDRPQGCVVCNRCPQRCWLCCAALGISRQHGRPRWMDANRNRRTSSAV